MTTLALALETARAYETAGLDATWLWDHQVPAGQFGGLHHDSFCCAKSKVTLCFEPTRLGDLHPDGLCDCMGVDHHVTAWLEVAEAVHMLRRALHEPSTPAQLHTRACELLHMAARRPEITDHSLLAPARAAAGDAFARLDDHHGTGTAAAERERTRLVAATQAPPTRSALRRVLTNEALHRLWFHWRRCTLEGRRDQATADSERLLDLVGRTPDSDDAHEAVWATPAEELDGPPGATVGRLYDAAWRHVALRTATDLVAHWNVSCDQQLVDSRLVGVAVAHWCDREPNQPVVPAHLAELVAPWPHRVLIRGYTGTLVAVVDSAVARALDMGDSPEEARAGQRAAVAVEAPSGYTVASAAADVDMCAQLLAGDDDLPVERAWEAAWLLCHNHAAGAATSAASTLGT